MICHYAVQLLTAIFINPEEMIAVGLHERIGDCNEMVPVETVLKVLKRCCYYKCKSRGICLHFIDTEIDFIIFSDETMTS